jgi:hypothetical protein
MIVASLKNKNPRHRSVEQKKRGKKNMRRGSQRPDLIRKDVIHKLNKMQSCNLEQESLRSSVTKFERQVRQAH